MPWRPVLLFAAGAIFGALLAVGVILGINAAPRPRIQPPPSPFARCGDPYRLVYQHLSEHEIWKPFDRGNCNEESLRLGRQRLAEIRAWAQKLPDECYRWAYLHALEGAEREASFCEKTLPSYRRLHPFPSPFPLPHAQHPGSSR